MGEMRWTQQQRQAIKSRGGSVLVSAAAGSGKTAVLVQRVMGLLLDPERPVDADRLLVVTFSNAAAQEMRQRLTSAIQNALSADPHNALLQRQVLLLQRSHISTVHAYCLELIRDHFHLLRLSPGTKTGDEKELRLLREEVLHKVVEDAYSTDADESFSRLVESVCGARDDRKLFTLLEKLYDFLRSHPFYRRWLTEKKALYSVDDHPENTMWGKVVLTYADRLLAGCLATTEESLALWRADEVVSPKIGEVLEKDRLLLKQGRETVRSGLWDDIYRHLHQLSMASWPRGAADTPLGQRLRKRRERVKKQLEKLSGAKGSPGVLTVTSAEFCEDQLYFQPILERLSQLLLSFDDAFTQAKQRQGLMDFADMEHYALQLLMREEGSGRYVPSELATWEGELYDELLIDEYQDTNQVQDRIFTALSSAGGRLFMVGDVKQSIYRFRQACPELFMAKKDIYAPYDGKTYPAVLALNRNFRSAPAVTEGINFLFSRLMNRDFAQIQYDDDEALYAGGTFPVEAVCGCEIRILDLGESENRDAHKQEAAYAARYIRGLVDSGTMVTNEDGSGLRPLRFGDVCILLRSTKGRGKLYLDALADLGIPAWMEQRDGFLTSPEVSPLVHLMLVLANPLLDISMAAVLTSPLFGLTADHLALLRKGQKHISLYHSLTEKSKSGKSKDDFRRAYRDLQTLSGVYASGSAAEVLQRAFSLCGYLGKVQVMAGGESRADNVMQFLRYAQKYGSGTSGGASFARFLERLLDTGEDLPPAMTGAEGSDAVSIMTIHRSKGLEFPIVLLCDCGRRFNRSDYTGDMLWNSEMGLAFARRDHETHGVYQTLPLTAMKLAQEQASLSEELRMLYVALTRAKERIVVMGILSGEWEKALAGWGVTLVQGKIPSDAMRSASCLLDWLMMAALHHPAVSYLLEPEPKKNAEAEGAPFWVMLATPAQQARETEELRRENALWEPMLWAQLQERLSFVYPYQADTRLPAKLAVSTLVKQAPTSTHRFRSRPAFLDDGQLIGAAKGTAMHTFMQFANYKKAAEDSFQEARRLVKEGFLSQAEMEALDHGRLGEFFHGALGRRIFSAKTVYREFHFLGYLESENVQPYLPDFPQGGQLLVQGIADCVFIEADGQAVLVDYKTDVVASGRKLVNRYKGQLEVYRRILTESLGVPIKECILYAFHLSKAVSVRVD